MSIFDRKVGVKCNECGKRFVAGNRADGIPNGVGFVLDDGTVVNVCSDCLIKIGQEKEGKDNGRS